MYNAVNRPFNFVNGYYGNKSESLKQLYYRLFKFSILLGRFKCKYRNEKNLKKKMEYKEIMSMYGNFLQMILFTIDWCKHLILEALF